jgi:hypothetical protein
MVHANSPYFERRSAALLRRLAKLGPFVAATLACVPHRCGNRRCRCAKGDLHPSWRLTYKDANQKTVTVYVPVGMLQEVRQWVKNHRAFKKLAGEISAAQLARVRLFVAEKRRRRHLA